MLRYKCWFSVSLYDTRKRLVSRAIVGRLVPFRATASGKTQVALDLAQRLGRRNRFARFYGSLSRNGHRNGQTHPDQTKLVPHHLIDVVDPVDEYSVSRFVSDAHQVNAEIRSRGKQVLFVGGTPLYLKTLLRGMFLGPPADWEFRQKSRQMLPSLDMKLFAIVFDKSIRWLLTSFAMVMFVEQSRFGSGPRNWSPSQPLAKHSSSARTNRRLQGFRPQLGASRIAQTSRTTCSRDVRKGLGR